MTSWRDTLKRQLVSAVAVGLAMVVFWADCAPAPAAALQGPTCRTAAPAPRASNPRCAVPHRALDAGGLAASPVGALGGAAGSLGGATSPLGGAAGALGGGVGGLASTAVTGLVLTAVGTWVSGGASFVLHETADVLNETTTPQVGSTWFSATYWKVAGIAAVLTLPFLFAACAQALLRSDITLLLRAAFGYLPLAMLAVAIAAPVTMLLLSASDELAATVSSASGGQGASFLAQAVISLGVVGGVSGSPFVAFLIGIVTVAGALFLWVELLMREAAVYVVVLMLPLAFAAFVWPARRIWAIRSVELLAALILSKFAIVAVLSLGAAALSHSVHRGLGGVLAGIVLLVLAAFTPWALLRLLPLAEVASSTAGALRGHAGVAMRALQSADVRAAEAERWISATTRMRHMAGDAEAARPKPRMPEPPSPAPAANAATTTAGPSAPAGDPTPPTEETAPAPGGPEPQPPLSQPPLPPAEPIEPIETLIQSVREYPEPPPDPPTEGEAWPTSV